MDIRLIGQKTVLSAYTARPAETAGKGSPAPAASAPSPVGDTLVLSRSVQDLYRQTEENLAKELLNPEQSGNEGDALTRHGCPAALLQNRCAHPCRGQGSPEGSAVPAQE